MRRDQRFTEVAICEAGFATQTRDGQLASGMGPKSVNRSLAVVAGSLASQGNDRLAEIFHAGHDLILLKQSKDGTPVHVRPSELQSTIHSLTLTEVLLFCAFCTKSIAICRRLHCMQFASSSPPLAVYVEVRTQITQCRYARAMFEL